MIFRKVRYLLPVGVFCLLMIGISLPASAFPGDTVVVGGLDKVTARITTFNIGLGETVAFGSLRITLQACDRTPPEEPPESTAFLDIIEERSGEPGKQIFRGWMFASSPALSAVEHPVYDVWVIDCQVSEPLELPTQPTE